MKNNFALPKKILIATGNSGKFAEISELLKQFDITSIKAPQDFAEPEETGETFAQNSLLKAKYYGEKTGIVALADDSGLCINGLNGSPGVHSARFALDDDGKKNFDLAFEKIQAALSKNGIDPCGAKAFFVCNLTIFDPQTKFSASFEGRVDGELAFPKRGDKGFGYDPIFVKDHMTQTFGEILPQQKDQISHRGLAFAKFTKFFQEQNNHAKAHQY